MDIKIEGFHIDNKDFYQKTIDLRNEIFVVEFGFNKFLEFDGKDNKAIHYIVMVDGITSGCARWIQLNDVLRIDRFGIRRNYRGFGLGLLLIKFIKTELSQSGKKIELLTTDDNILFFIQQGFKESGITDHFENKKVRILSL